jgi:CheY-like chemotaxis protein
MDARTRARPTGVLKRWGLGVKVCISGAESLVALGAEPFNLVILDCLMPDMDGFQTAAAMKKLLKDNCPPIIMLSSSGKLDDRFRAHRDYVQVCVDKPVLPEDLLVVVLEVLGQVPVRDQSVRAAPKSSADTYIAPLHILLAEDNKVNQLIAGALLQKWGHSVEIAETGKTALGLLQTTRFDLVFMDVQMPEMDGLTATRVFRQRPEDVHTPIVAMTANAMEGDREACLAAGMDDYISKPINREEMMRVLVRFGRKF